MLDVSIIIVNYKTVSLIINTVKSIKIHTNNIKYEIIIVDNNSQDDVEKILYNEFGGEIVCVLLNENIGFGCANNEGIKIARGRNTLFLNPDTLLLNNAIKILSDYLDGNESVGACGGNLYDEQMKPAHSYDIKFPSITHELRLYKLLYWKNWQFNSTKDTIEVAYITGADLMVKKSVLNRVGLFSDRFFMYYEDSELCFRIHKGGYKIISVPFAKIQHLEGKSFYSKLDLNRIIYIVNGRKIFYSLHYSAQYMRIVDFVYVCMLYLKISVFYITNKDKYKFWSTVKKYEKTDNSIYYKM
ncbi:MAG: glycosyltransferase family 2 protein [Bacteroidales bacterium]|jgi:GT2 family glycosyltransferase|nr:glycosyltransferase family 2 protein [Bacteroidales bacterium]